MSECVKTKKELALLGGPKSVSIEAGDTFTWPIVTEEHEQAVLEVLRRGAMSGTDVTIAFEKEYAEHLGRRYALGCNTGTAAIQCAFFGLGVGVGDEVICPSITYWASVLQVYALGATPVFAEVDPKTLCLDAKDIENRITERTKVIVPVHYAGMPCDMDAIMAIAEKHGLKVMEDCSHAHGGLYRGKEVGTFGDAAGFSLMSGKSLAIGEAGMMFTDDQRVYERGLLFGHYERHGRIELEDLKQYTGLPCGGHKYRMHQLSSAFGRVQLRHYPQQMAEIDKAMNTFCDLLDDIDGIKSIRPAKESGNTKGGWYFPLAHYDSEMLGDLSAAKFAEAVCAEGATCGAGCNAPLHTHRLFTDMDVYGHGKPTRVANLPAGASISQPAGSLPISEGVNDRVISIPWFKHYRPRIIEQYAGAFRKVAESYADLLPIDDAKDKQAGGFSATFRHLDAGVRSSGRP